MSDRLEELKKDADFLGYRLVKKQESSRILPCACGAKRSVFISYHYRCYHLECKECGLTGTTTRTKMQAITEWSKMIETRRSNNE